MNRYDFILETVRDVGAELMRLREEHFSVTFKGNDPKNVVTDVDMRVNTLILERLAKNFPDERVYSEETEGAFAEDGVQWIIDPIDGTSNFSRGIPHFAVVLGVVESGVPAAGAVFNPVTNELFSFKKGEGAFLNGKPIHVSATTELSKAGVLLHAGRKPELQEWGGSSYTKLLKSVNKTSNFSCLGLDICFVAAGRVDACVYGTFSAIDATPALGILAEAGGVAVAKDGSPVGISPEPQPIVVANNDTIAETVRTLLFS